MFTARQLRVVTLLYLCSVAAGCAQSHTTQKHYVPTVTLFKNASTFADVGAGQGLTVNGNLVYIYGDAKTGVIREATFDRGTGHLVPTGRDVRLTIDGEDVAPHPTGLTIRDGMPTFMGDTVNRRGVIHVIDFAKALSTGTLDGALIRSINDDAAVNGTRPCYAQVGGRWLIATSDYGNSNNVIRLYDPQRLLHATSTRDEGVLVHSFPCGPFVQNVFFIEKTNRSPAMLVLVQNITPGLGWRLTMLDLEQSIKTNQAVILRMYDFTPKDELEGAAVLGKETLLLISASSKDNVRVGLIR